MGEGTTIYCGDNCNHTGPHRYAPTNATTAAAWSRPMNADAVAALLHDVLGAECSGTHSLGYATCQRQAAALAAAPLPSDTPADGLDVERLMAWLGPSHPHDEGRECGTCAAYNYLAATLDHREQP